MFQKSSSKFSRERSDNRRQSIFRARLIEKSIKRMPKAKIVENLQEDIQKGLEEILK